MSYPSSKSLDFTHIFIFEGVHNEMCYKPEDLCLGVLLLHQIQVPHCHFQEECCMRKAHHNQWQHLVLGLVAEEEQ
jgi:hypothetical protein